jgi:hypothetical protein
LEQLGVREVIAQTQPIKNLKMLLREYSFKRIFSIDFLEHNESGKCVDDFDKILIIGPVV